MAEEQMNPTEDTKETENLTPEGTEDAASEDMTVEEAVEETDDVQEEDAEASAEQDEETAEDGEADMKKGGFFKKKDKKDKKDEQIEQLSDQLLRSRAEFDNYRKRTEKEKAARFDMGRRDVVEKLLPVLDNFERGLGGLTEEQKKEPFADGMDKVLRQLEDIFKGLGVEPIEAVGQPFNPDLHNAVMHVEDEELGENTVAEEFQKGYTMGGTVIRYSMVKVAN